MVNHRRKNIFKVPSKKLTAVKKLTTVKPSKAVIIGSALATAGLTLYGVKKYLEYVKRNQTRTPFPARDIDDLINKMNNLHV